MSPRNKSFRKILSKPLIKGFKPFGLKAGKNNKELVSMLYEEYEAIRLCDYEKYDQLKASEIMGISRPTFTRIYAAARKKLASSIVEGKPFIIEGGKVWFDSSWLICELCNCKFTSFARESAIACPLCGNTKLGHYDSLKTSIADHNKSCLLRCQCPACGYEQAQEFGIPCQNLRCPTCGAHMAKKKNQS